VPEVQVIILSIIFNLSNRNLRNLEEPFGTFLDMLIYLLNGTGRYTSSEIGSFFDLSYPSVRRIISLNVPENNGQNIYLNDADRDLFLETISGNEICKNRSN